MAKLTAEEQKTLNSLGIKGKTREGVKKELIDFLSKQDIPADDDDSWGDLMTYSMIFSEDNAETGFEEKQVDNDEETTDEELKELSEETGENLNYEKMTLKDLRTLAVEKEVLTEKMAKNTKKTEIIALLQTEVEGEQESEVEELSYGNLDKDDLIEMVFERELLTVKIAKKKTKEQLIAILEENDGGLVEETKEPEVEQLTFEDFSDNQIMGIAVVSDLLTEKMAKRTSRQDIIELLEEENIDPNDFKPLEKKKEKTDQTQKGKTAVLKGDGEKVNFNARGVQEHEDLVMAFVEEHFEVGEEEGQVKVSILKQGFTVRMYCSGNAIPIMNFDELKVLNKDTLFGHLYLNRFKSVDDLMELLEESFHDKEIGMFRGESHPSIRKVTISEVSEILKNDVLEESIKRAKGESVAISENAKKLKESSK